MKILHYGLGFPPYRSGGLTKFCMDIMAQQAKEKNEVAMIWPGEMKLFSKKINIKENTSESIKGEKIRSFEIINPLPVPFDEGIAYIDAFMKEGGEECFSDFLDCYKPDIIHVHTLMGLHKSFLKVAQKKYIRLVFTAHDFFPICPKVMMYRNGNICNNVSTCRDCGECNKTALPMKKIILLQSKLYRKLKESFLVKKLRKRHRDKYFSEGKNETTSNSTEWAEDYLYLREYYHSMLKMMDVVHYNSTVTKNVYETYFELENSYVISITHSDIKDKRCNKKFSTKELRIRYLGSMRGEKGYFLLKSTLDELWKENKNFRLDIHFQPKDVSPYMRINDKYTYEDLGKIFENTDILVAPSLWYETFGYTVLEALSYGVPVILSDTVGAKDIVEDKAGIIVENINKEKLLSVFKQLDADRLLDMNKIILEKQKIMTMPEMTKEIRALCYKK